MARVAGRVRMGTKCGGHLGFPWVGGGGRIVALGRAGWGWRAGSRLSRTASARAGSAIVVSSHEAGQNSRQFAATDAASVTSCTLTPIWQLPVLPSVPQYCRATHGE